MVVVDVWLPEGRSFLNTAKFKNFKGLCSKLYTFLFTSAEGFVDERRMIELLTRVSCNMTSWLPHKAY